MYSYIYAGIIFAYIHVIIIYFIFSQDLLAARGGGNSRDAGAGVGSVIDLIFTRLWPSLRLDNKTTGVPGAGVYYNALYAYVIIIIIFDNVYVYDVYLCRCGRHATPVSVMLILSRLLKTV